MKTFNKSFILAEIKADSSEEGDMSGKFEGYASVFGNIDNGKDIMEKGCFRKSLKSRGVKMPILANHDSRQQIGWNIEAKEDKEGLYVKGEIDVKNNTKGREVYSLMRRAAEIGTRMGLSVGFRLMDYDCTKEGVCRIKEADLLEYSIVPFPMNEEARVTSVKSFLDDRFSQEIKEKNRLKTLQECARLLNECREILNSR